MATSILPTTTTVRTASLFVAPENQKSDEDLLTDIFQAYYDARENKRNTYSQMRFECNLSKNLIDLYDEIKLGQYKAGRSVCFIIDEHVKREVFAASFRDRIVHHLLFNYLNPVLDGTFIEDCYSCRKTKGTSYGIERMQKHMRDVVAEYGEDSYILKLDICSYFMHIRRNLLYDMLMTLMDANGLDDERMRYVLRLVVFNDPTKGCRIKGSRSDWDTIPKSKSLFFAPPGCGLPIGNLTSQLFSNVYLSPLDHFITEELGFSHYGRYVDDFYLISNSKERLLDSIPLIRSFLSNRLFLSLHPHKVYLQKCSKGARFLGSFVTLGSIRIDRNTASRCVRKYYTSITYEVDPFFLGTKLRSNLGDMPRSLSTALFNKCDFVNLKT